MIGHSERSPRRASRRFADLRTLLVHGFVLMLMLLGIGGGLYKFLRPGGWLSRFAGGLMDAGGWAALFGVGVLLGFSLLVREWLDDPDRSGSRGDVLLYAAMSLGVFFAFELLVNGTL